MAVQKEKLFNIYFFVIAFVNLASATMMQMFNSTIALHIDGLDYKASVAGTLISIGAVSATIYRFFGGKLCEKGGRRRLILIGLAVFASMSFFMGQARSLPILYILRVFQMFGYSMASTCVSIAVIDVIPQKRVGEGLGYYSLAASIPQAFGPSVALFLYHMKGGFMTVMVGGALIGLIALSVTWLLLDYEKRGLSPKETEGSDAGKERGIWKYIEKHALSAAWVYFFVTISGSLITMYLTLYAQRNKIINAGFFYTFSVVFMVVARIISGKLSDKKGALYAVIPGLLCLITGYVLLIFGSKCHILFFVAGAFYGLGTGMASPALNAQAVKGVRRERISIASSTFFLPMDISFMAGSVLWGVMIDYFSFTFIFIVAAALSGAAMILSMILFAPRRRYDGIKPIDE